MKIKSVLIILVILFTSCSSDKCDDSDLAINFPAKFRIASSNDVNQLSNPNFNNDFGFDFSIVELNGESIIESQIINTFRIVFEYDGINRFEVVISDRQTETIDCVVETLTFSANSANGALLCDINDIVTIEFDI